MKSLKCFILESCNSIKELSLEEAKKYAKKCKIDPSLDTKKTAFEHGAEKINWWKDEKNVKLLLFKDNALISCKKYENFVYVFEIASFVDSKTKGIFKDILKCLAEYMDVKEIVWQASDGGSGKLSNYYDSIPNVERLPKKNKYSKKTNCIAQFLWTY